MNALVRQPGMPLSKAGGLPPIRVAAQPLVLEAKSKALPVQLERLVRQEASMRWLLPSVSSVTPASIEMTLRGAMAGNPLQQWELFDLMEDTSHRLQKNLNEIKNAVMKLDWKIEAWAEEDQPPTDSAEEKAKLISHAIWKMQPAADRADNAFEGTLYDILDSFGKGTSVLEIEWEFSDGGVVLPKSTAWVHPQNYAWHQDGWLGLRLQPEQSTVYRSSQIDLEPFPENKFLIANFKGKTGHPLGAAKLRSLAWLWCAANFGAEWVLNYAQLFGQPLRWATYDPARPGLLAQLSDMLENMGSAGWAAFPEGTKFELKEAAKSGSDNPQAFLLSLYDKACDLLILGQTLTTDVGDSGSRALGEVHSSVRDDVIQSCADFAARIINSQLVPAILRLNYGDDSEAPEFCPAKKTKEDAKANAERDKILIDAGLEMPEDWLYKRHNVPLPQPGERVIKKSLAAPSMNPDPTQAGDQAGSGRPLSARRMNPQLRARDAQEKLVDAVLEDLTGLEAKWLVRVKPFFAQLVAAAQHESVTDVEFTQILARAQKQIPDLLERLDVRAVAVALEASMGAACVNGAVKGFLQRPAPRKEIEA